MDFSILDEIKELELSKEDLKNPQIREHLKKLKEYEPQLKRERCKEDLVYLCTEILGYKDLDHQVYRDIADRLQNRDFDKPNNLMLIPRTCMKTSLITIGSVIQDIIKDGNVRILITNAILDNAKKMLHEMKAHFTGNPEFMELFPELAGEGKIWREDEITVRSRTKNTKEMTVEISSEGHTKTSKHYDRIVADDLVTRENVKTEDALQRVYRYFQDLFDILEHPDGVLDVVGTRWSFGDLYGIMMHPDKKHLEDFLVFWRKAYEGDISEGRFNFPWKLNKKTIEKLRRNKTHMEFTSQYLNDPQPDEDAAFYQDNFIRYETIPEGCNYFLVCDPAATQNKKSDYSAIIVIAVDYDNNWYIADMVRDKLLPGQLVNHILTFAKKYAVLRLGIENMGFQAYVEKEIRDKMRISNSFFNIVGLKPKKQGKTDRIRGLEPRFANKTIFFPKGGIQYTNTDKISEDLIITLETELMQFPKAMKDDLSDALSYGLVKGMTFAPVRKYEHDRDLYKGEDGLSRTASKQYAEMVKEAKKIKRYEEEEGWM
ncbi:MAG: hypothetical protein PF450_10525 [Bacteroidales bacterium]|jgi:predicted phage terminase large subunit-like protein|nr:hypothetical protein [Bacteroidales bacterium]